MPRIIGYTPSWLSRPSPGAKIFSDPEPQSPVSPSKRTSYIQPQSFQTPASNGPRRTIASRGSEIFTVVGNKIRWANLSRVQDEWEEQAHGRKPQAGTEPYRTLVTPVYYQITQLSVSPSGTFLAICTEHTVHIAVLPDSSRLSENDRSSLKLKTYQLGPTTHVIPESPLASVLWHPLAASTSSVDCLVTVTNEAAVRLWEIDRANHWSFERPALAIDLRKLADGVSSNQDFEPLGFGKNRGFSADTFDMEASATCFGGEGTPDEDGWAGMTLWTAMSNGDVYALCPLLPSKWRPSPTTIPALSISAVSRISTLDLENVDADERKAAEQQYEWVQEIDNVEPMTTSNKEGEIRYRPQNPSAVPRLQGPFEIDGIDELEEGEITDIHVIAARLDEELLLSGEDEYETSIDGIQYTTVCLNSSIGQSFISIELDGISGQWLPKRGRSTFSVPTAEARDLVLLDKVTLYRPSSSASLWPVFTPDYNNAYSLYVTTHDRIISISLSDWASRVGMETTGEGETDHGLQTRLALACESKICVTQEVFTADAQSLSTAADLSAPTQIFDINIGQMLVSSLDGQACAVLFDNNSFGSEVPASMRDSLRTSTRNNNALVKVLEEDLPDPVPTRAPYAPAETFYQNQLRPLDDLRQKVPAGRRSLMTENPVRLSPACLDIMTLAHRTFSQHTSNIEKAAAELFRRCERLREELADQVKQMSELADRLQHIKSTSEKSDDKQFTFDDRLEAAQERQRMLKQRYEAVRRKSGRIGTSNHELSSKEQTWIAEVETLAQNIGLSEDHDSKDIVGSLKDRYDVVQSLTKDVLEQSKQAARTSVSPVKSEGLQRSDSSASRKSTLSISTRMQRERVAEVMSMVEREGAIIDAVMSRLSKLNVG